MTTWEADIVIVGSGAAGGTLAATLAESTRARIVLLERGGHFTKRNFNQREWDMARLLYAEHGTRSTDDGAIPVRGGECVGGGTTVNIALCFDPVRRVWEGWKKNFGLEGFSFDPTQSDYGLAGLNLATCLAEVRARLGVHAPGDSEINENNRTFLRGCEKCGLRATRFELNMQGCVGCGFCSQGCAYDAKRGTLVTYVPDAVQRGVTLVHHAFVNELLLSKDGSRAVGVSAQVAATQEGSLPNSVPKGPLTVRAKLVILAAEAIETPMILARSVLPDPHGLLGRGLVLHPSLPIVGFFPNEIAGHRGIEGSYYSDHYAEAHGFYLECLFGHPVYGAALLPGFGRPHLEMLLDYRRIGGFGVMLVDASNPNNRVVWSDVERRPRIHYTLTESDQARMRFGAERGVEVMFAAGAREVVLPVEGPIGRLPSARLRTPAEATLCRELSFEPHRTVVTSAHCQATVKMGEKPERTLLNSRGETRGIGNVIVCDSSAFPESCGANPMISIATMARYQGKRIAHEWSRYSA